MKFLLALVVLVAATFADPKGHSKGKLAEISKKLEEQSKKVEHQNQRQEEQDRQREEQNKKLEEREADAQLRAADARILQTNEKQAAELRREAERREAEKRQAAPKRQDDACTMTSEARKLMVEEILKYLKYLKYHAEHNDTTKLIKLIDSEIRRLTEEARKIGEIVLLPYQGSAGATSTNHNFLPDYAFIKRKRGEIQFWNSDGKSLPQWVWFKFLKPHRLARIGFPSHEDEEFPKKFQVVGSSDCASWTVMLRVEISDGTKEFKSWDIPEENRTPFRCIGLKVEKCWEGQTAKYIELHKVQMWEEK